VGPLLLSTSENQLSPSLTIVECLLRSVVVMGQPSRGCWV